MLQTNSELNYATDIVVVKVCSGRDIMMCTCLHNNITLQCHLADGSQFQPILKRQRIHDARATPTETKFDETGEHRFGSRRPSLTVQTHGSEYIQVENNACPYLL